MLVTYTNYKGMTHHIVVRQHVGNGQMTAGKQHALLVSVEGLLK